MRAFPVLALVLALATLHAQGTPAPVAQAPAATVAGDAAARGKVIFEGKGTCLQCHAVKDQGSRFGPDLTDIALRAGGGGAGRGRAGRAGGVGAAAATPGEEGVGAAVPAAAPARAAVPPNPAAGGGARGALLASLIDPDADIQPQNRTVRAVTRDGTVITGRMLNHDTFSVQLIDAKEHLVSLNKPGLKEFSVLKTSSMPSFRDKLSGQELEDVVAYMLLLRGTGAP